MNEERFTFHLQRKHSGKFANRKFEELSYTKKSENVRPHSSNSIENATPSSGTSPLASYKDRGTLPRGGLRNLLLFHKVENSMKFFTYIFM